MLSLKNTTPVDNYYCLLRYLRLLWSRNEKTERELITGKSFQKLLQIINQQNTGTKVAKLDSKMDSKTCWQIGIQIRMYLFFAFFFIIHSFLKTILVKGGNKNKSKSNKKKRYMIEISRHSFAKPGGAFAITEHMKEKSICCHVAKFRMYRPWHSRITCTRIR